MKKINRKILLFCVFAFLIFVSSANADENCEKMYKSECLSNEEQRQIQDNAKNPIPKENCEKCIVEDDEYCIYNQCYFDKQYRLLKTTLKPNDNQEKCLDVIYMNFKTDLEILCEKYSREKDKLLYLISDDNKSLKEQKGVVKSIKSDIKEKYKDYLADTNEILSRCQKKEFKRFKRKQNKKIKKIKKYGAIYKFPCS